MNSEKILIVDDDVQVLFNFKKTLEKEGYNVNTAASGEKALEWLASTSYDLVLTDIVMDGIDGMALLKKIKEASPKTIVILITGFGSIESAVHALRHGAVDYMLKPCQQEELTIRIRRALDNKKLEKSALEAEMYQKMSETLGAVAHEINNPLTAIIGFGELLELEFEDNGSVKDQVSSILKAADRISGIIRKMKEIRGIETKQYTRDSKIIDIQKSSEQVEPEIRSILVVDDEEIIYSMASQFLKMSGYDVDTAENGMIALEKIEKTHYNIVILDISMPGIDGYETLVGINKYYSTNEAKKPATIMMTGYDVEEILDKCKGIGAFAILHKPFSLKKLLEIVKDAELSIQAG